MDFRDYNVSRSTGPKIIRRKARMKNLPNLFQRIDYFPQKLYNNQEIKEEKK